MVGWWPSSSPWGTWAACELDGSRPVPEGRDHANSPDPDAAAGSGSGSDAESGPDAAGPDVDLAGAAPDAAGSGPEALAAADAAGSGRGARGRGCGGFRSRGALGRGRGGFRTEALAGADAAGSGLGTLPVRVSTKPWPGTTPSRRSDSGSARTGWPAAVPIASRSNVPGTIWSTQVRACSPDSSRVEPPSVTVHHTAPRRNMTTPSRTGTTMPNARASPASRPMTQAARRAAIVLGRHLAVRGDGGGQVEELPGGLVRAGRSPRRAGSG